jgi:DNA-binding NarL/FixJ family response regulator
MRVLIVDDHPLYREGLKALLAGLDPNAQVADASNVAQCLALSGQTAAFDLVLLDMNMPGASGLAALEQVKSAFESACVVVVSADEDPALILQVIDAGAAGYIPKSTDPTVTINALRLVLAHGIYLPANALRMTSGGAPGLPAAPPRKSLDLSDRQRAVLYRLLQGKSNKVIARDLDIAEGTVKAHLWAVYQILGVASRAQAMCRVHELGLLEQLGEGSS